MMKSLLIRFGYWGYIVPTLGMIIISIMGITATLSSLRDEAIATHRHIASLHARTFEEHFAQTLQNIEHTMDRIPLLRNEQTTPEILSTIFEDLLQNTPYLRSLSLVNEKGIIEVSSHHPNVGQKIDINNFLPIPFGNGSLLRIGVPKEGRDFDTAQNPIIPLDISFIPILKKVFFAQKQYYLVGSLNTDYFTTRYISALSPINGTVSFWRLDGMLLFSTDSTLHVGSSHCTPIASTVNEGDDFFAHIQKISTHLVSAFRLARILPFVVEIKMNEVVTLAYWNQERNKVLLVSTFLISLCGFLGLLLFLRNWREMRRQKKQIDYEKRFRLAMEATQTGLWTWNLSTNALTWDKQCYLLLGYSENDFVPSIEMIYSLTHPDDAKATFASIQEQIASKGWFLIERRMKNPKGEWIWIQVRGRVTEYTPKGEPLFLMGVYINIDDQKQAEQLRISAVAFETEDAIIITDAQEKIIKVNQAFTKITGYSFEDIEGKTPRVLKSGNHDVTFYKALWASLNEKGFWQGELSNKRKNGEIYIEHVTITAIRNAQGILTHYLANFNDITLHKAAQKEIQELAYRDPLTHLSNRHALQENLVRTLARNAREQIYGALIFLDLDHFKELNDTFGHDAGDMLLIQVAKRLNDCTRQEDMTARLGGDEFIILLENLGSQKEQASAQALSVAMKILARLNKPYALAQGNYTMGVSIGITIFKDETYAIEELIKQADMAMYQAKEKGRNQICFFNEEV